MRRCALGGILTSLGKYEVFLIRGGRCAPRLRTRNNTLSLEKCRAKPPPVYDHGPGGPEVGGVVQRKTPAGVSCGR